MTATMARGRPPRKQAVERLGLSAPTDLSERMVAHHLPRVRELLRAASKLPETDRASRVRRRLVRG